MEGVSEVQGKRGNTRPLAGLLANVPIVVDIGEIEPKRHEPKNKTITLVDKWN